MREASAAVQGDEHLPRNVEIKARLRNIDEVRKRSEALSGGPPEILQQEDVFFPAQRGRLKLRRLGPDQGQLISYERPDVSGPKTCAYAISQTREPQQLREVLSAALGEATIVKKVREVYIVGQTRIHLDDVEGLGAFMELEVVLAEQQSERSGEETALKLMAQLGIEKTDLVEGAYADLLREGAADG